MMCKIGINILQIVFAFKDTECVIQVTDFLSNSIIIIIFFFL